MNRYWITYHRGLSSNVSTLARFRTINYYYFGERLLKLFVHWLFMGYRVVLKSFCLRLLKLVVQCLFMDIWLCLSHSVFAIMFVNDIFINSGKQYNRNCVFVQPELGSLWTQCLLFVGCIGYWIPSYHVKVTPKGESSGIDCWMVLLVSLWFLCRKSNLLSIWIVDVLCNCSFVNVAGFLQGWESLVAVPWSMNSIVAKFLILSTWL